MKLSNLRKDKKPSVYRYSTSYSVLVYENEALEKREFIWNSTNLLPPEYVYDKEGYHQLKFAGVAAGLQNMIQYKPEVGSRYLGYKSKESFVKGRKELAQLYWDRNIGDCQKHYEDFTTYFALCCHGMNKQRLELFEVN